MLHKNFAFFLWHSLKHWEIDDFSYLFKGRFNALFHSSLCWFIFFKLVRTFLFHGQKYKAAKLQQQAWKVAAKAGNSTENAGKDQQNTLQYLPFYNIILCSFCPFATELYHLMRIIKNFWLFVKKKIKN